MTLYPGIYAEVAADAELGARLCGPQHVVAKGAADLSKGSVASEAAAGHRHGAPLRFPRRVVETAGRLG